MTGRETKAPIHAANTSVRELLLFGLLPLLPGAGLLVWAYYMHLQQLRRPLGDGLITFLNAAGGGICLICCLFSAAVVLAKLLQLLFKKNVALTDNISLLLSFALVLISFFFMLRNADALYRADVAAALNERGIVRRFPVESRTWRGTRYPHFELRIRVPDEHGSPHALSVEYPADPSVDDLDSVAIRYLPANPEIYRCVDTWYKPE